MEILRNSGLKIAARYAFAILAVGFALLVTDWLDGFFRERPFMPFFLATLVVVVFAGPGPGALATVTSDLVVSYYFLKPFGSLEIAAPGDNMRARVFLFLSLTVCVAAEWMRRRHEGQLEAATIRSQQVAIEVLKHSEKLLKDVDRRKDEFIATLAHELRNPLAAIHSATYALGHAAQDTDKKRTLDAVEIVDRQLNHLILLVDDLLEVSRIDTGKINLDIERVELADVLRHAAETAGPEIKRGEHAFKFEIPEAPIFLEGDRVRLAQIFANLLNNAAKYTDRRGTIKLSAERSGNQATILVRDSGIGIAPEMLPRIFDLFAQSHYKTGRAQGGLGIGLALVKRLVELHHGTVEARSDGPGRGSSFIVRLPLADPQTSG